MLSSSVDTQSIRLKRIQAISASQEWILGKIIIDIGGRLIVIDNCMKSDVKTFAELANQFIREKEEATISPSSASISIADEIGKLKGLHSSGILTDSEFSEAKARLIAKL